MSGKNIGFGLGNLFKKEIEQPVANATAILEKYNNAVKAGKLDQEKFNNATANNNMTKYLQSLKGAKASQEGYNASLKATSIGSKAAAAGITFLNVALNSLVTMGVSLVIQGLVTWISKLATAQQDAIDTANEMAEAYKSTSNEILENIKSVESMQKEFERLSRGVDDYGNNIALSADEYARYKEIVEQIVGISPSLITGYDKEGNAIANKNGLIERSIELMKEEQRLRLEEITSDEALKKLASGKIGAYKQDSMKSNYAYPRNDLAYALSDIGESFKFDKSYDIAKILGFSNEDWSSNIAGTINPLQTLVIKNIDQVIVAVKEKRAELLNVLSVDQFDQIEKIAVKYEKDLSSYENSMDRSSQALNPSLQLVPQTLTAYQKMTDAQKEFIAQYVNGFRITADTTEKDVLEMSQSIKDFADLLANDDTAKQAINDFFALDKTALSASDWQSQANSFVDSVANALQLTEEEKLQLKVGLKIDDAKFDELISGVQEKLKDEFDGRVGELSFADFKIAYGLEDIGEMTFDELIAKIEAFKASASTIPTTLQPLNISLTDIADKTNTLATAWKEMDEAGEVSIATITKLIETDANWADSISIVNGKITINKDTIVGSAKSIILAKKQEALAVIESCEKQIEMLQLSAKASRESAQEFIKSASATALAAGMAGASGKMYFDEMNARANGNVAGVSNFDKEIANARKSVEIFDTMLSQLEGDDPFRTTTDSAKDAKDAINDLKQAMSSAQSAINSLLSMTMDMIKQGYADQKKFIQNDLDSLKTKYDIDKKGIEDSQKAFEKTYGKRKKALEEEAKAKKKQYDDDRKALEDQLDAFQKLAKQKLDLLQKQESDHDYQSELSEKEKAVTDIKADISTVENDDSDEGIAKKRELQELLAERQKELDEYQHDHSIELQEDAINNELSIYEEQINNKLDILDREYQKEQENHEAELERLDARNERRQANHDAEMERLDADYEKNKAILDNQIKDIENYVSLESNIRAEAIKMIEDKNSGLYQKLLDWNKIYGDSLDSTVINAWGNAYSALDQFNVGQLNVLDTLNQLAIKMNDFNSSVQNAASNLSNLNSMPSAPPTTNSNQSSINSLKQQLDSAYKQQQMMYMYGGDPKQIQSQIDYLLKQIRELEQHHTGILSGFAGGGKAKMQSNEVFAKLLKGEATTTPEQMDKFIRQTLPAFGQSIIDTNKYERINQGGDITFTQGDIIIQGDASKKAVMDIDKIMNDMYDKMMRRINRGSVGNMKVL